MKRALSLSSAALLSLAACGEAKNVANEAETTAGDAAIETATAVDTTTVMTAPPAATDTAAGYAAAVAQSDLYEIEASRLALERSNSPEIQQYAQMIIDSHGKATAELRSALASSGLAVTPALDARHQGLLEALRTSTPLEFDTAYLDQQTMAHSEVLGLHRSYADRGDNGAVKSFAAKTVPIVEAHLALAKKLDESGADEPAANPPQ